ncbi:MAG: tetratricopeptide repeat protein [Deltaproteobacteria bacterium]|jgi:tetratricopeptide (TPR) repeat protein|nr:tetratricopeptide repeat protein [Deltaproteobacteria bacterium]
MRKDQVELYHHRESTRHFLHAKAEADDLHKKRVQVPASIQKAIQSIYPGLLTGQAFLDHALERLAPAPQFAGMVFQIDDDVSTDCQKPSIEPAEAHKRAAKLFNNFSKKHDGIWGLLNQGLFGTFFIQKNADLCLTLVQQFQQTSKNKAALTVSAGIAEYPFLNYQPADVIPNALKALEHAAFFGPNSTVIFDTVSLNISGDQLFDKGDINGSIEEYQQALKMDPTNTNVHNSLGVCYGLLGEYEKAKLEFNSAVRLNHTEVMAWYNMGFIHMLAGDRYKALDLFFKANAINQDVFEVNFQTGRLLMELNQPESGKKFLERAAALEPTSGAAFRYLGECYTQIGNADAAVAAYKKAIKYNPSDAASLSAMGCLFAEQEENPEIALMFCKESIQLAPENGLFRYRLGQLYYRQNRLDDALKEFKQARRLGKDASDLISEIEKKLQPKAPRSAGRTG